MYICIGSIDDNNNLLLPTLQYVGTYRSTFPSPANGSFRFYLGRAAVRILSKPSVISIYKPRFITTLTPTPLRLNRSALAYPFQKRFASDEPSERHPALQDQPTQPQAQSAQPFDISEIAEIQPADAREVPQPEQSNPSEQYDAAAEQSAVEAATGEATASSAEAERAISATSQAALAEATAAGLASGSAGADAVTEDPELRMKQLYVGNLFFDVTEDDLRREFARHGTVTNVKVVYDNRGLSKG